MTQKIPKANRLSLYVFILIFILLTVGIIIGYFSYQNYSQHFRNEVSNQLSTISKLKVGELEQWRKERLGDGNVIYKNISFTYAVRRFFENPKDTNAERQLQSWIEQYQRYYEYDLVRVIDSQGLTRFTFPAEITPLSSFIYQHVSEVLQSEEIRFIDFYRNEYNRHIYLAVMVPILDDQDGNRPLGIVVLRIDPQRYLYPLISRWPTPTRTAETQIVRREGNDALFLNEFKYQKNTALNLRISLKNTNNPAVKAALGGEGVEEGIDYRGVPVIADIRRVSDSPWFMIARMDISEVYAPMRERLWQLFVFIGILLLVAGLGLGYAWWQKSLHFYRERYEAAEELRESEKRYREFFKDDLTGDYISDPEGKLSLYNPAFANIFGFSSVKDPSETCMADLYIDQEVWKGFVDRIRIERKIESFESERKRLDGSKIQVIENAIGIFDKQDEFRGIYGYIFDITKRKTAEEALRKINKELEQFAYIASHDLQEPIRLVNSFTQLLEKRYKDQFDETAKEYMGIIIDESMRMQRLIKDLLDFSRIGRLNSELESINCNHIVGRIINVMAEPIKEKNAQVTFDKLPLIYTNETSITQLFQNLIVNALKFQREGVPPRVHISAQGKDGEWLFSVEDNGIGINRKYFEKLFIIFQRLHSNEEYPGTGIGLATCKKIVELHGGRIWVESVEGEGSTFYFTFPVLKV